MPSSRQILEGLARITNEWQAIAIAWHVVLGLLLLSLLLGWRPSRRLAGVLLATPLASVSALAWATGNPFNGTVFAAAAIALASTALSLPRTSVRIGPPWLAALGSLLLAFGWVYPHFLEAESWTTYLYAAPLGLIPCPSLSAILGIALIVNGLDSPRWSLLAAAAGVLYGVFGAFRLGVAIDLVLLAGAGALTVAVTVNLPGRSAPAPAAFSR